MKKNVSGQIIGAQMCSATDGSNFTGSVTVYVNGDGGTQSIGSVGSGVCTHEGNGFHSYAPSQAETNYDHVAFTFIGTGAISATVQVYPSFPQTGDAFARLGAPAGASVSADIAGVQSDTNDIQTRIPAALVSGRIDASVGAMAANTLTASALASDAVTEIQSGLSTLNAAGVRTAVGLASANLDTQLSAIVTDTAEIGTAGAGLTSLASAANLATLAGYVDTEVAAIKAKTDNLPASPAATSDIPSAGAVADAVWDEAISGHLTSGTTGAALNAAGSAGDPWATTLPGAYGAGTAGFMVAAVNTVATKLDTTLTAASGSPGEYQFTADALELAPTGSGGGSAPSAAAVAAAVWAEALPGGYGSGQAGKLLGDNLNTTVSSRASQISVDTLAGYVDTEVAAIKAKTDNLPASPAATSDIPSAGAVADAVWDEAISGHVGAGSVGLALRDADLRGSRTTIRGTVGTATTPSTTQFTPSALDPSGAAVDQFKGRIIVFDNDTTTAALRGQATDITASTSAGLPLLTFTALTTAPSSGDTFSVL
jgi:hypothetical protein